MKTIEVIIGRTLSFSLVRKEIRNERAFLSIIEQAGEGLEILEVFASE
jgi:hypothetical protein